MSSKLGFQMSIIRESGFTSNQGYFGTLKTANKRWAEFIASEDEYDKRAIYAVLVRRNSKPGQPSVYTIINKWELDND